MFDDSIREEDGICASCIGETFLRDLVMKEGSEGQCRYCCGIGRMIELDDLAARIETAFEQHFSRTASEPSGWQYAMHKDKETSYHWEPDGEQTVYAIMSAADIPEKAAADIQAILAHKHFDIDESAMGRESEFSDYAFYEEVMPGDDEWQKSWHLFEKTIKSESRFFSRTAARQLSELFDSIDVMTTQSGKPLVIDAGPRTRHEHLYRARVFQSANELLDAMMRPDKEMAAPPSQFASAGRMNAKGISVFYGATSSSTALAEVRPPVGSRVAVARFDIIRPVRLLDLTALGELHESGSIFDTDYARRLGRMMFLRKLSRRIARPVMPNDRESEYLPTQAVADFLATEAKVPIDGILFPSVQVNGAGMNIVLFHKASRCKELEFPAGTNIDAHTHVETEFGVETDYRVHERVPSDKNSEHETRISSNGPRAIQQDGTSIYDDRAETIAVDLDPMIVSTVNAVQFHTDDHQVKREKSLLKDPHLVN